MFRLTTLLVLLTSCPTFAGELPRFERIVIDDNFPGGYQVELADVNGDRKPDIVALGGSTLAWYENPSWKKRLISDKEHTPDIISSATGDLDGDGKAEIAVAYDFAMNEPKRGKLLLATQGKTPDDPWVFRRMGDYPSIHRLRLGDIDRDGKLDLIVAPIFGARAAPPAFDQDAALLRVFLSHGLDVEPARPDRPGPWPSEVALARLPVIHAIEFVTGGGQTTGPAVLTADNQGVGRYWLMPPMFHQPIGHDRLVPGAPGSAPKRGSSEIHLGKLSDGRFFLATIDPWHGSEVAVCVAKEPGTIYGNGFGPRRVIDDTLADGHALWVADVDGDGNDEVFAGHRGKDASVSVYRFDGKRWERAVLDAGLTAQDLRGGDIDGDGTPDVVAIGGRSHNVVWFRPVRAGKH
jgi:hypothetical protein